MKKFIEIEGNSAEKPEGMSVKAQMAWDYFFDHGWACIKTGGDQFVVVDESFDLTNAELFPDEEALIEWLEAVADEHMEDCDAAIDFLRIALHGVTPGLRDLILNNPAIAFPLICSIGATNDGEEVEE